ncbi:MAG: mechanosensitive ion channel family protein [Crocinitomicaceae bacterium]|nr:mechanosensitive ion channel family protein [Crocinitomicaceae bacterium]
MKDYIIEYIKSHYYHLVDGQEVLNSGVYEKEAYLWALGMFGILIVLSVFAWFLTRFFMIQVLHVVANKSRTTWDDHLVHNKVFRSLAHLVPLMFMEYFLSIVFYQFPKIQGFFVRLTEVLILWAVMVTINRFLSAIHDIITEKDKYKDKPIQSYIQVGKIVATGIMIVMMLSVVTNQSPLFFLTSLGAMTAILVLVFKDTILGFIGSIQLATNDIIRIGDWVTMEKYGADGDVEGITLSSVKIRNFDKTITTIPTYAFISDSFKNWRGMEESEGRRIKRSVQIQIDSVEFASNELVEKLKAIAFFKPFIEKRQKEIEAYNEQHGLTGKNAINARRMTNLGLFRRYIEHYLQNHPQINKEMTLMVRQLAPNEHGIPLEIYCFSQSKVWEEYENLQADVFDHLFAVVHHFELSVFERPTGRDFRV